MIARYAFLMLAAVSTMAVATCVVAGKSGLANTSIIVQSTTSTQNSGLFQHILPIFERGTGIKVKVVAVGTGQALRNAQNGDGDVLLVHAKFAEEKFVAAGWGVARHDLMYNDFVIVGPLDDPAAVAGLSDAPAALARIAAARAAFVSRGDHSGTHKAEMRLWKLSGIDVAGGGNDWYRATGSGMGTTLNIAAGMGAYALTDRATWISFKNKRGLKIHVEGDGKLFNQYGVILVNPKRHRFVKAKAGRAFIRWLVSKPGQSAIASFKLGGKQLFFPNAGAASAAGPTKAEDSASATD